MCVCIYTKLKHNMEEHLHIHTLGNNIVSLCCVNSQFSSHMFVIFLRHVALLFSNSI